MSIHQDLIAAQDCESNARLARHFRSTKSDAATLETEAKLWGEAAYRYRMRCDSIGPGLRSVCSLKAAECARNAAEAWGELAAMHQAASDMEETRFRLSTGSNDTANSPEPRNFEVLK
jgi:hypothetical protein